MNHDQRLAEVATINTILRTLNGREDSKSGDTRDRLYDRLLDLLASEPADLLVDLGDGVHCTASAVSRVEGLAFPERYDRRHMRPGHDFLSEVTFTNGSTCFLRITAEEAGRRIEAARKPRS